MKLKKKLNKISRNLLLVSGIMLVSKCIFANNITINLNNLDDTNGQCYGFTTTDVFDERHCACPNNTAYLTCSTTGKTQNTYNHGPKTVKYGTGHIKATTVGKTVSYDFVWDSTTEFSTSTAENLTVKIDCKSGQCSYSQYAD